VIKARIKVEYEGLIDTKLDANIINKLEGIGAVWYAQGQNREPDVRDICFDLEIND